MGLFEKFKESSGRWNCFSKSDTLGSFDFMTLTIALDALCKDDVDKLLGFLAEKSYAEQLEKRQLSFELYETLSKTLPLAFHEYTHFIDTTCTPWGVDFLKLLNGAYLVDPERFQAAEANYHYAKDFFDTARAIRLPQYYTALTPGEDASLPWSYQVTSGRWFTSEGKVSNRPIPFVAFGNSLGHRVVRSPLSMVSLLEASAMAQEYMFQTFLVAAISEEHRTVESALFNKKAMAHIYNPTLTEYSVCAHLVANSLRITDVMEALTVSSRLVHFCLNATDELFSSIEFTDIAKKRLRLGEASMKHEADIREAIRLRDRGFLFYLLTMLMDERPAVDKQSIDVAISEAATKLSINSHRCQLAARRHVEVISEELKSSPFQSIAAIAECALENFDQRESGKRAQHDFTRLDIPPVILGDCTIGKLSGNKHGKLINLDIESCYTELVKGQLWVEKFSEACA
ncbi:hypothetical protein INT08_05005 [Prosthecochloris sp. N3]|uniref:Uncharacterized protein n=1 Tax=Prosthecochloris ethylica TaxID=2743976 RepID=A0ABR9XR61_9CHLB|nr:hypothetical protein [Prosthecochloris ethylica]MBF0586063.1 hypothetical protein [Prosthecochloris ethylica]MBF0636537.1 hypothetical protein [Prosthecochloris ethylica]NUK47169.1 hypothetical protein [Prosthecochloris ethylica]